MAPRTAILLLALLGAVLCLYSVVADEVTTTNVGGSGDSTSSVVASLDEKSGLEGIAADVSGFDRTEVDDDTDTSGEVEVAHVDAEGEEVVDQSPAHPLARMLTERSSRRCWSKNHCKKYFKKPGCCKKKCVNLASDNRNCGKCGKCCDTKKGYCCRSGKCRKPVRKHHSKPHKPSHHREPHKPDDDKKPHKPHHSSMQCGYHKKCNRGYTCCKGKCVNLKSNSGHCGKCNKGCRYGSACSKGKCVNLKHDSRNCGKTGRSCGYGRKCCNGCCKNIFGNDKNNCGACGKKCATRCSYGMCGYGH